MQYQLSTLGDAMYAPCARNSLARVCSTRFSREVTFLALSLGTVCPQFEHCTTPVEPFPPFVRPRLARLSGMGLDDYPLLIILQFACAGQSAIQREAQGTLFFKKKYFQQSGFEGQAMAAHAATTGRVFPFLPCVNQCEPPKRSMPRIPTSGSRSWHPQSTKTGHGLPQSTLPVILACSWQ